MTRKEFSPGPSIEQGLQSSFAARNPSTAAAGQAEGRACVSRHRGVTSSFRANTTSIPSRVSNNVTLSTSLLQYARFLVSKLMTGRLQAQGSGAWDPDSDDTAERNTDPPFLTRPKIEK